MKIRIKFAKYGTMKFIGHLDVMRFFQKAIRRADIDIKYSEGFSPHQIMSFAAPLGVGIESRGEYLDIEVHSFLSTEHMKDALNKVMVEGLEVLSVKILPDSVKNAMASVAAAKYQIAFGYPETAEAFPVSTIEESLAAFYAQEQIPITKKTKKNTVELDLKPGIYELKTEEADDLFSTDGQAVPVISMLVNASSSGNIKPSMVIEAFSKYCHVELPPYAYRILRVDTYTNLGKEGEENKFTPLESVGKDS